MHLPSLYSSQIASKNPITNADIPAGVWGGGEVSKVNAITIISDNVWTKMQKRSTFGVSTSEITIIGLLSSAEGDEEMKDAENKEQLSVTGVVSTI